MDTRIAAMLAHALALPRTATRDNVIKANARPLQWDASARRYAVETLSPERFREIAAAPVYYARYAQ